MTNLMIRRRGRPGRAWLPRLVAAGLLAAASGAGAQEPAGAGTREPSAPLLLRVKPGIADGLSEEARARQERLEARMRRNEFLFRSICRTCSSADRFESGAPFHPHQALGAAPGRGDREE